MELKLNAWQVLRGLPMLPKSDLGAKVLTCCLRGEFWGVDTVSVQGLLKRAHEWMPTPSPNLVQDWLQ